MTVSRFPIGCLAPTAALVTLLQCREKMNSYGDDERNQGNRISSGVMDT